VLLVSPRPEDEEAAYIDHRVSAKPLVEILGPLGELVELTILQPPTFWAMSSEIERAQDLGRPYHVVHFDGHGFYDKRRGVGALCFEFPGDTGRLTGRGTAIVEADRIAVLLSELYPPVPGSELSRAG